MATMNIGRLAEQSGVSIDTIRYYERQRVLPPAARTATGYRHYSGADLDRLRFIRRSKELGFSLEEIKELLSLTEHRHSDMRRVKRKAEQRLAQVERKIVELKRVKRGLKLLIEACPGKGELDGCPIVAALSGADEPQGEGR
jgi:MerR family copper efflux transcriptional regulator